MMQIALIGIGAGGASALLYASLASGSLISLLLICLAPLPILIAALGWSHWAALVATFAGAIGLAAVFGFTTSVAFVIRDGLPAWWLGYLALLARPATRTTPDGLEWYPVGHLVFWAALTGALTVIVVLFKYGFDLESVYAGLRETIEKTLHIITRTPADGKLEIQGVEAKRLIDFLVVTGPPGAAVFVTIMNMLNLWLAGRIVLMSGRLRRPWPDLAAMTFPAVAPALLVAAFLGTFITGMLGLISNILGASFLLAYAVLGLAVLHAITRGMPSRPLLLSCLYAAVFIFSWPLLLMTLLGLADAALNIRDRFARKRGPPSLRT